MPLPPMKVQTLFLSWQTRKPSYWWFPVGRMDIVHESDTRTWYRFRYTQGAKRAQDQAKFPLLLEFPKLERNYKFGELFPVFQNRVTRRRRPDFISYVHSLGLTEDADAFDILSVSGRWRVTDPYGVFPKLKKDADGNLTCRFFLNGSRSISKEARERVKNLRENESLHLELTRSVAGQTAQILTEDHQMIGWAPRYIAAILAAVPEKPIRFCLQVVQNNFHHPDAHYPGIAPFANLQILIEMHGNWGDREPMSSEDFQPLVD